MEFHPLADLFPLMEGAEFDALVASIKAHALRTKITLYEGKILDGRNRYRAMLAAGHTPSSGHFHKYKSLFSDDTPLDYVIRANLHRRHLTAEQKREIIADLLKADPTKSDRQIAGTVKASPTFVGKVRAEKEATGDVSTVDTRTDTKGRQQPAKKPTKKSVRKPEPVETAQEERREPEPAEQPKNNDLAFLSNPIVRAWGKATNAQRKEFALEFKELIDGFVDAVFRRLPYAEQRRRIAERLANDLDTKIETEEKATDGAAAGDGDGFDIPTWLQRPAP